MAHLLVFVRVLRVLHGAVDQVSGGVDEPRIGVLIGDRLRIVGDGVLGVVDQIVDLAREVAARIDEVPVADLPWTVSADWYQSSLL